MSTIQDIDHDHGVKVQLQLSQISTHLRNLPMGQPLVWLYVWDVVKSTYADMSNDDGYTTVNSDYCIDDVCLLFFSQCMIAR